MDNYTKIILTVIAVALMSISFQLSQTDVIEEAKASRNNYCGEQNTLSTPCWVHVVND